MDAAPQKVTVLISGTQGEPMSALSRVAVDNHKHISVEEGDTVVLSSRIIPGNEKGIFRMIDHMARRGADVLYGSMNPPVHVSGHASMEEMKLVLNLVRPRYFVPIHGEFRQLTKHARLAEHLRASGLEETFVMESGDVLEIDHHGARRAGKVTVGRVCIDSGSVAVSYTHLDVYKRQAPSAACWTISGCWALPTRAPRKSRSSDWART